MHTMQDVHDLKYSGTAIIQSYISRPLLVGGYKCDLRLYVLITSLCPLTVYLYDEAIVRYVYLYNEAIVRYVYLYDEAIERYEYFYYECAKHTRTSCII